MDFITFSSLGCILAIFTVQAKSMQKWYFLALNPIFKKFSYGIWPPALHMQNIGSNLQGGGGGKCPPCIEVDNSGVVQK